MRKVLAVIAVVLLVGTLLGILAVFIPPTASEVSAATGERDYACEAWLKDKGVGRDERIERCRIEADRVYTAATDGYFQWKVGNAFWEFRVEVIYRKVGTSGGGTWIVDSVDCWKKFSYLAALTIDACRTWDKDNGNILAGARYTVTVTIGWLPISVSGRSYIVFRDDGSRSGLLFD
jgi:hypothetical protein